MPHPVLWFGIVAVVLSLLAASIALLLFRRPAAASPPVRKSAHRPAAVRWRFRSY
jgi:hypothetical protein